MQKLSKNTNQNFIEKKMNNLTTKNVKKKIIFRAHYKYYFLKIRPDKKKLIKSEAN